MKLLSQLVREIYICQGNKRYLKNLTVATIMVGGVLIPNLLLLSFIPCISFNM